MKFLTDRPSFVRPSPGHSLWQFDPGITANVLFYIEKNQVQEVANDPTLAF